MSKWSARGKVLRDRRSHDDFDSLYALEETHTKLPVEFRDFEDAAETGACLEVRLVNDFAGVIDGLPSEGIPIPGQAVVAVSLD